MTTKAAKKKKYETCHWCGGETKTLYQREEIIVMCNSCLAEMRADMAAGVFDKEKWRLDRSRNASDKADNPDNLPGFYPPKSIMG